MKLNTPQVAIISSLSGGLGHYCAHLVGPLSKLATLKFITYPQIDLSGIPVKFITDSFVKQHIRRARFDLDEQNPVSIVQIEEYLKSRDINVINIHIGTTVKRKIEYFTTFFLYIKQFTKIKIVYTMHDVLPFDEDKKLVKMLKVFYSLADSFTVGNEAEKQKLMRFFQIPETKITVIPHGIYNLFDRKLYNKQMARDYLDIAKDKKVILFFGWLREYKGLEYLIKATRILAKKQNNVIVYVASGLKYASKDSVEKYLKLINKYKLQDNFMLNLKYLDTLDLEAVFKAADVVALPYTNASQSGVMQMSFGFKKPVIITDVFYEKTWINGKAGYVAKAKDPESIADKLTEIFSNDERLVAMGEYGYTYASEKYNWENIAEQYNNAYLKTLKTK
ncbi:glycosyltransferase [soil metagenome]